MVKIFKPYILHSIHIRFACNFYICFIFASHKPRCKPKPFKHLASLSHMELPEDIQREIVQYQALQNQLATLQNQLTAMKLEISVLEEARKEVEKVEGTVYRSVGPVLIEQTKEDVLKWIDSRMELLQIKIKSLDKKIQAMQNMLLQLKKKLEQQLSSLQGGVPSG